MQPHVLKSLRHAREIPCMLICSGTSRLVVINGEHLPQDPGPTLLELMLGKPYGLGGTSSQSNKVAVVQADHAREAFTFHFYQIIHQTGQMKDDMECSNAAAASGLFARLSGVARPRAERHQLRTTNLATGQHVQLTIPAESDMWLHPWGVRFELTPEVRERFRECGEPHRVADLTCHLVPRGNLFVFCQIPPEQMTEPFSQEIARQASPLAISLGRAREGVLPKIIPYEVRGPRRVAAASFFEGERHASLPGSAAMALGLFLRLQGAVAGSPVTVEHPSGSIEVSVGDDFTEFSTPVKLLLHGAAPVNA